MATTAKQPRLVPIICMKCKQELIRAIPGAVAYCPRCKRWTAKDKQ